MDQTVTRSTLQGADALVSLLDDISGCTLCTDLPLGPRPVLNASPGARILIAGQAPGTRVHETGIPFDDPSGDRLRQWMGVDRETFYDQSRINIVPMGFCYPGRAGGGGDLPPRPECRRTWHARLFELLPKPDLILVIGQYSHAWHLDRRRYKNLTETVRNWREFQPGIMPLPHPSPRNNIWLAKNPWFGAEVLPALKARVREALS